MSRIRSHIDIDRYLPIKRIVMLSLVVTMAYYFLFTLNHYFARPSFDEREAEQRRNEAKDEASTMKFDDARAVSNERRAEFPVSPEKMRKDFYKKVLLNIPMTFIMVFTVLLLCRLTRR